MSRGCERWERRGPLDVSLHVRFLQYFPGSRAQCCTQSFEGIDPDTGLPALDLAVLDTMHFHLGCKLFLAEPERFTTPLQRASDTLGEGGPPHSYTVEAVLQYHYSVKALHLSWSRTFSNDFF